ncbi:MAG: putative selenium-dependent hydroxylase accessory protein YqeC [Megasphaera sp.]|nr:putative selenium-dependent hydroxylase accessory protein YqeC [Megasphaera sp.]MCI1248176.1 putative selenium-dependent hydroxylase accessory protein YqeC [Megasphaera sp.]
MMKTMIYEEERLHQEVSFGSVIGRQFLLDRTKKKPAVITFVGAGGKTTLLYELAREWSGQGRKVLVVTTTHMYEPVGCEAFCTDANQIAPAFERHHLVTAGRRAGNGKITFIGSEAYRQACTYADIVLVEGDGAKRFPFKICNQTEPVIPANTRLVIAVAGLTAIGEKAGQVCFRYELAGLKADTVLTAPDAAALWVRYYLRPLSGLGYTVIPVLNQADTAALQRLGTAIFSYAGVSRGIMTARG